MKDPTVAEARVRLNGLFLRGLAADAPDAAETERLALAVRARLGQGDAIPVGDGSGMTPRGALTILAALSRVERETLEPPRMPTGEDVTTTVERLDAALRSDPGEPPERFSEPDSGLVHPARAAASRAVALTSPADLLRLATGGTAFERRAAVERLDEFLRGDGSGFGAADRREIVEALELQREGALGLAIDDVLAAMPGAPGGRAQTRRARAQRILERFERDVRRYWEGDLGHDPTGALDDENLAALGTYVADAADIVVGHIAETLRRLVVEGRQDELERVVSALALGADERLVPALLRVLQDGSTAARVHAAKALEPVDDPRVPAALRKAYRHAATDVEKVVLGGVLAAHGDRVGAGTVLDHLAADQPPWVLELALLAMAHVGEPPHVARVAPFLASPRASVARAAAAALGSFGDSTALGPLGEAAARPELGSHVERAVAQIRARMALAGHRADVPVAPIVRDGGDVARRPRTRLGSRILGRIHYAVGLLWWLVGRRRAALRRFDLAHEHHPYLVGPLLARASILLRGREIDAAVSALRVALRVRASAVLQLPERANFLIRAYLRYADSCAAAGRPSRALEALDELLGYDLSFADVDLHLDARRRRDFIARSDREEG